MRDRGVVDVREGDMFALRDAFERDRFASALAIGTQIGLAGSMRGLSAFLGDLAFVTTPGATAVIDSYDPDHPGAADLLGYREDPTPGLAHRVMWFAYDGETDPTDSISGCSPPTGSAKRRSGRDGRSRRWTARGPETGPTTGPRPEAVGVRSGLRIEGSPAPYHAVSAARPWSCARIARNARTPVIANAPPT